jgi:hypothetical protein
VVTITLTAAEARAVKVALEASPKYGLAAHAAYILISEGLRNEEMRDVPTPV